MVGVLLRSLAKKKIPFVLEFIINGFNRSICLARDITWWPSFIFFLSSSIRTWCGTKTMSGHSEKKRNQKDKIKWQKISPLIQWLPGVLKWYRMESINDNLCMKVLLSGIKTNLILSSSVAQNTLMHIFWARNSSILLLYTSSSLLSSIFISLLVLDSGVTIWTLFCSAADSSRSSGMVVVSIDDDGKTNASIWPAEEWVNQCQLIN